MPGKRKASRTGQPLSDQERLYVVLWCRKPEPSEAEIGEAMVGSMVIGLFLDDECVAGYAVGTAENL